MLAAFVDDLFFVKHSEGGGGKRRVAGPALLSGLAPKRMQHDIT